MQANKRIIIVDDQRSILEVLGDYLETLGYEVISCNQPQSAAKLVKKYRPFLMLTDLTMPKMTGLEVIEESKALAPELYFIMMTGHATIETAVDAMRLGVEDYVEKPINLSYLRLLVEKVEEKALLKRENEDLRQRLSNANLLENVIGESEGLRRVGELVRRVAPTQSNVLVVGESGTGKELIAKSLHAYSRRRHSEFVTLDCVALPESLFESELYGYEKGAFTGANSLKEGLLEKADGGTIFFDEVVELSLKSQAKLLRVLQERKFRRLGGSEHIFVDVRIVASTKSDLAEAVADGRLLEGLYYRLNVIEVIIPPLRERLEDIPSLINEFQEGNGKRLKFSSEALKMLQSYSWPGNVRQLKNVIERLSVTASDGEIGPVDLPEEFSLVKILNTGELQWDEDVALPELKSILISRLEKDYLMNALRKTGGNVKEAALISGISRKTFHLLIKKYGLSRR